MNHKGKGTNAERELLHMLWRNNWACVRTAGSGSMKYDSPDILTGNHGKIIAIECKVTKSSHQYFSKEEIFSLRSFSHLFGAEPYVAVKFNGNGWSFFRINSIRETEKNFCVSKNNIEDKPLSFEDVFLRKS